MTELDKINAALQGCSRLRGKFPGFPVLDSVEAQLKYLKEILDGSHDDRSRLGEIVIGVYAAREFEERDMDFANLLYDVEEIVDLLKAGKL